jgi:hypothetical protein
MVVITLNKDGVTLIKRYTFSSFGRSLVVCLFIYLFVYI